MIDLRFTNVKGVGAMQIKAMRAVIYKSDRWWVAQFLEKNVAAFSKSLGDLHAEMLRVLAGHLIVAWERGIEPFRGLNRAPDRFFEMWNEAKSQTEPIEPLKYPLPEGLGELPVVEKRLVA